MTILKTLSVVENNIDEVSLYGVSNSAFPLQRDHNQRSLLHLAASRGHLEMVKLWIELKLDPQMVDKRNRTALDDAAHFQHNRVCEYLRGLERQMSGHPSTETIKPTKPRRPKKPTAEKVDVQAIVRRLSRPAQMLIQDKESSDEFIA